MDRSKAARGVLWSLLENGGLAVVSFSALVLYTRYLSVEAFGLFSIVLALVELLSVLVGMLFHDALVQREEITEKHYDSAFTFSLMLSVVLVASCVAFGSQFEAMVGVPRAGEVLAWTSLCLPSSALSSTLVARLRREMAFRPLAIRSLVGRLGGALVGVGLVLLGAGVWGLVAQQVLIVLVGSAVLWWTASDKPRLRLGLTELVQLLGFGVYAVSTLFVNFAVKRVFVLVTGVMLGAELAGYLNLSFRAVDVLWALAASAVGQVALPVLARLQTNPERLKRAYRGALSFTCVLLYPCFVGLALVAPEAVELVFGPEWLPSVPYVMALGLLIVLQAPRLLSKPVLTALGRPREALIPLLAELGVVLVAFAAFGVPSLAAAVTIWVVREIVAVPVVAVVVRRVTGLRVVDQFGGAVTPLAASACMAAAVVGLRLALPPELELLPRLSALVLAGGVVFVGTTWLMDRCAVSRVVDFLASAARGAKAVV